MSDGQTQTLKDFDAASLAKLVRGATDEQLAEGMADRGSRKATLDEIFRRMAEHVEPEKAQGNDAVVHWKILDRPGGGYDHFEVVLEDGSCTVSEEPARGPSVILKIGPVDFLKLVSGKTTGPTLFMTGRLKIEGDLLFAARLAALFRIPRPASEPSREGPPEGS